MGAERDSASSGTNRSPLAGTPGPSPRGGKRLSTFAVSRRHVPYREVRSDSTRSTETLCLANQATARYKTASSSRCGFAVATLAVGECASSCHQLRVDEGSRGWTWNLDHGNPRDQTAT